MSTDSDSNFIRTFTIVLVALAGLGVGAFIMASLVAGTSERGEYGVNAIVERVAPVGEVNVSGEAVDVTGQPFAAAAAQASAPAAAPTEEVSLADIDGAGVYNGNCGACHAAGIAGAPKFADAGAWGDRIAQGVEVLYDHAINGYVGKAGVMPARGGNARLSDAEVMAAVNHMVVAAGGEVPEAASAAPAEAAESAAPMEAHDSMESHDMSAAAESTEAHADMAMDEAMTEAAAAGDATDLSGMDLALGKTTYDSACWLCHNPGAAGAPKFADVAAWEPRIAKGMDTLYDHAINGFQGEAGLMPPKGGRTDLSDDEVRAAVAYMVDSSR